ncbi:MAG: hypothetical protein HS116_09640 [Planctomycetes bacterium]|nr:hypothetical protein [Planctomycetota bacterium]
MRRTLRTLAACAVAGLLAAPAAWAQGCPMCREAAGALPAEGQQALNLGILMLLLPPLAVMLTFTYGVYRYIKADRLAAGTPDVNPEIV